LNLLTLTLFIDPNYRICNQTLSYLKHVIPFAILDKFFLLLVWVSFNFAGCLGIPLLERFFFF